MKSIKSKAFITILSLIVIFLAGVFIFSHKFKKPQTEQSKRAIIVNPKFDSAQEEKAQQSGDDFLNSGTFTSFITLSSSETLLSSLSFDFDGDFLDDQIVIVRKAGSQYLWIVVGINLGTRNYKRVAEIKTEIAKAGTFSYSSLDLIGNHSQALVYQGIKNNGDSFLEILMCENSGAAAKIFSAGTFSSDGTVFIQQTERTESYELGFSNGESFSVWVYSSDKNSSDSSNAALNQVQTEYRWNSSSKKYEFNRKTTVNASHLAFRELSRIQDGTVETFAGFLDGLWYKTSNTNNTIRYLYFDYASNEIIFLNDDIEEVYIWEDSKLRHNGIYLTTTNSIISSLQRRLDITLSSVDEIKLTVRDDVQMVIAESSLWDGQYKKTGMTYVFPQVSESNRIKIFEEKVVSKNWQTSDGQVKLSFDGQTYKFESGADVEYGIYSIFAIGSYNVLQIRSFSENSKFDKEYSLSFGTQAITETVHRQQVTKIIPNEDVLILNPVKITPKECFPTDSRSYEFKYEI